MTKTITYYCSHCGAHLESDAAMAGKEDVCPSCGKSSIVPTAESVEIAMNGEQSVPARHAASRLRPRMKRHVKVLMVIASCIFLILVVYGQTA